MLLIILYFIIQMIKPTQSQVERWISKNFPDYKTRKSSVRGEMYLVNNPLDPDDHAHHLAIAVDGSWAKDYRPTYMNLVKGSLFKLIMKLRKCSFVDAIKEVCGNDSNISVLLDEARRKLRCKEDTQEIAPEEIEFALPPGMLKLSDNTYPLAKSIAINYLSSRAITLESALEYGIMYDATRLCFPYYEYGVIVYWQTRDIMNKRFEFPAATMGVEKSNYVYGFDHAEPNEPICVVESIFNAMSIGYGAVATGGADIQPGQIRRLKAINPSIVILAPDNDDAGKASLATNYEKLCPYFRNKLMYVIPPVNKDWNDFAKKLQKINKPIKLIKEFIESKSAILDTETIVNIMLHLGQ